MDTLNVFIASSDVLFCYPYLGLSALDILRKDVKTINNHGMAVSVSSVPNSLKVGFGWLLMSLNSCDGDNKDEFSDDSRLSSEIRSFFSVECNTIVMK